MILFFIFLELFKTNLFYVKKFRKTCYFILFILSTLLTPPEVIYQVMVSLCSILLYEAITVCTIFKTELLIK
jgi:Sec-independent protein secretion pathway component TatC